MADRVGQQVGNYRLVSVLGQGGFADVYLGEHVYLKSYAALKFLQAHLNTSDQVNFLEEARLLVNLIHPHIVRVLDFGMEQDVPFLVMDYASNGSLRQLHPRGSSMPLNAIVNYVKQIADALQYAHDKKVIHRDIKPENMLLGHFQEVLLSDFGIALLAQSTRSQSIQEVAGTAAYMAPEQIQGKPRPASDQYALGVVVYEWLSGTRPFNGSFTEIASQHLFMPPPDLRLRIPTLAPAIEQVVFTALAKDPKQRFATIHAFATALEQAYQVSKEPPFIVSQSQAVQPMSIDTQPKEMTPPRESALSLSQPSPTELVTPPSQPLLEDLESQVNTTFPTLTPSAGQVAPPPHSVQQKKVSRRTVLKVGAGVAVVGIGAGSLELLKYAQASQSPTTTHHPLTTSTTNEVMFGVNPQHIHFSPDEHILSPTNVSRLILAWSVTTAGTISISSPAVVNDIVYIGSLDSKLYAVNAKTGKVLWTVPTGDIVSSSPAVVNGIIYFGSVDHKLYAINATTSKILWTVSTGGGISSSPVVSNGVVYIGSWDSKLYALDATKGTILWTAHTGNQIISTPAVANGVVYVGSWDNKLYAIKASTGTILWTVPTGNPIFSSPAVANGVVYVGSRDGKLYALDATKGTILWTLPTGNQINSSPAVANGVVYVGSKDSKLYALDASTGVIRWTMNSNGEIASSPFVTNGVIYVGSWDHKLYAINQSSGQVLWETTTGDGIESSPAVVNGYVFVGSRDSKLYAFTLPSTSL